MNRTKKGEPSCANALSPNDFVVSYYTSLYPLGIYKIIEKEKSRLWHMHQDCFIKPKEEKPIFIPSIQVSTDRGEQMNLF